MQHTSDADIAKQVTAVPEMFGFLIDRYESKMFAYVRRITHVSEDDAQGIVQDVFIKAYENIASYNPEMSFNAWIYRICHNTCINVWKKDKRNSTEHSLEVDEKLLAELQSDIESPLQFAELAEMSDMFESALGQLSEKHRSILLLRFYEEMSYEEIADILQIPPGTVATNINRAKKKLQTLLAEKI